MAHIGRSVAADQLSADNPIARPSRGADFWSAMALLVIMFSGWAYLGRATTAILPEGVFASLWARWIAGLPLGWLLAGAYLLTSAVLLLGRLGGAKLKWFSWKLLYVLTMGLLLCSLLLILGLVVAKQANSRFWMILNVLGFLTSIILMRYLARMRRNLPAPGAGKASASWLGSSDLAVYGMTLAILLIGPAWAAYFLGEVPDPHPMAEHRKTTTYGRPYYDTGLGPDRIYMTDFDVKIDPHKAPLLGSPDADHFLFFWLDYTDPSCREINGRLLEVASHYGNRLAVVPIPYPLDGKCNPHLMFQSTAAANAKSCEYARLALGVWKADPKAFEAFHHWLFESPTVPSLEEALTRARSLVDLDALDNVWDDPQINEMLFSGIKMTPSAFGARRPLPKVAWSGRIMTAEIAATAEMIDAIDTEFFTGIPALGELDTQDSQHVSRH